MKESNEADQDFEYRQQLLKVSVERARIRQKSTIGTQSERMVHTTLKYYLDPDEAHHEVRIGPYIADVFDPETGHIFEIQTRAFDRLRGKLDSFLKDYQVTVVFPVAYRKFLSWVDPDTGEVSPKRLSPHRGSAADILPEIWRLPDIWDRKGLDFLIILLDLQEFRSLDGWSRDRKKGSHRMERLPLSVYNEVWLKKAEDFDRLLPTDLPATFSRADLCKSMKLGQGLKASQTVSALERTGTITLAGREGRRYIYKKGRL